MGTTRLAAVRPSWRWGVGIVVLSLLGMEVGMPSSASAAVLAKKRKVTVRAGKTARFHLKVDPTPPVDVALVFDTTASLGHRLAEATAEAAAIVTEIQHHLPGARFAVAQFRDKGDKPEYRVEQKMTASPNSVAKAVGRLTSRGGGDLPEAYNLAFRKSFVPATGGPLGWRSHSRKFVVVLGDAEPHGAGTAGIADCQDTSVDSWGLDTAAVLSDLAAAGRTLVMVHVENHHAVVLKQPPASFECYQGLAAAAGGTAVEGHHGDLRHSVVHAVTDLVPEQPDTALEVSVVGSSPKRASRKWVTVTANETHAMTEGDMEEHAATNFMASITPPRRTKPGTYRFYLVARADGVEVGRVTLSVEVRKRKGSSQTHHM
jgi:hypothetical protein